MTRRGAAVASALLALCIAASAAIRPSFSLYGCSWEATHIVVVSEGKKIDGEVTVLESWWGDLEKGATLHLPELAAYADERTREISDGLGSKPDAGPDAVTGARMVLFLKRDGEHWLPAAKWGGFHVSVAWIESGKAYAHVQVINPGDAILVGLDIDEAAMKEKAVAIASARVAAAAALAKIRAIDDAGERAKQALALAGSTEHYSARQEAFEIVTACGKAAAPHLCEALRDDTLVPTRLDVIKALAEVGGAEAGEALTALLDREIKFWKESAPSLESGWWNGKGIPWDRVQDLRNHYGYAHQALQALAKIRYERCKESVTELELYWTSLPQLDEIGKGQMTEACAEVLRQLR